jgi:phytoene desaturase
VDRVTGSFFAAMGTDLPADVFLSYMSKGSSFKQIGFVPGGTGAVWPPLAEYVESRGGAVWLDSPVTKIVLDAGGRAASAEIEHEGRTRTVTFCSVVSNVGPLNTARLIGADALPEGYFDSVERATNGASIITFHFASRKSLVPWNGLALAGKSRRLTYAGNYSAPEQRRCTEPGWYLYSAASTPRPAVGEFDLEAEKALLLEDIREYFPGFDEHARILAFDVTAHEWPAQRAITGFDLLVETPVPNLWNVGDGVKPWGDAGTAACARSAEKVVAQIVRTQSAPAPARAPEVAVP